MSSCTGLHTRDAQRVALIAVLETVMCESSGWPQIHAADALLDHGVAEHVRECFAGRAEDTRGPFRIGTWRVMARASKTDKEREQWVQRIQAVVLEPGAVDRLAAAETLAKLGVSLPEDRASLEVWIRSADEATAPYPIWLLLLSSPVAAQSGHENHLVKLLDSKDPIARLRAGVALGKLTRISSAGRASLKARAGSEAPDSPARLYLLSAALIQNENDMGFAATARDNLVQYLRVGSPAEQLEAATTLGRCGQTEDRSLLEQLLGSAEPDARIGGASGLLYSMQ